MKIFLTFLTVLCFVLLCSCNAPHSNPVDPANQDAGMGTIEGTVQTFSLPYSPIAGVTVIWKKGNALSYTDSLGHYKIEQTAAAEGYIVFMKEGYRTDSVEVNWSGSKKAVTQINLNKMPVLESASIYTVVINQYSPPPLYEMDFNVKINDKDNDIDSVYVTNAELNLRKSLEYNVTDKTYQGILSDQELHSLNIQDIEEIIGLDFNIIVKDIFGREYNTGSQKITRVIKSQPENLRPAGGETYSATPLFSWNGFNPGYKFHYMLEIYTNDLANSQLVFREQNIPSDSISYKPAVTLQPGSYYWVLWIIDQFENRSRSTPKTFDIQ